MSYLGFLWVSSAMKRAKEWALPFSVAFWLVRLLAERDYVAAHASADLGNS